MSHLNALQLRLSNERNYLAKAKTEKEKALRKVWIEQIEKEIAIEATFWPDMSDEELLRELTA